MSAFSTSTSILSPSQRRRRLRVPTPSSSNLINNHSTLHFTVNNEKQLNRFNTVAPLSGAAGSASTSTTTCWVEFGEKVSGEWDGFGADFTAEGKPTELPEYVVPEAYREWEVKVFDWQTQCPTLAQSQSQSLAYKTIKLLPTVGCEADAATVHTIQERNISAAAAFAYQWSGSYVAVWQNQMMELEHCLIHPRNKESRVRIIQLLELPGLKLSSVRVFVEQWYGPFRNGDQLGGCSVRDSAFAATQPLEASQVSGLWESTSAVANFHPSQNKMIQHVGDERSSKSLRDEDDLILLPKQLWCSVKKADDNLDTCCEVGWLLDEGRAITAKCILSSSAELKEIAIADETRL
ncbi:hypothetical protein ACS0TY_033971 [Phlomoides rotata]